MNQFTISRAAWISLLFAHCTGMMDLIALPIWIGTLVNNYHFLPAQAGKLVTLFLLAVVAASVLSARYFNHLAQRLAAGLGYASAALFFALCSATSSYTNLLVLHLLAGLGIGVGLSMTHGAMGHTHRPHRTFALAGLALGITGTLVLGLAPAIIAKFGGLALFYLFASMMALAALGLLSTYPRHLHTAQGQGHQRPRFEWRVWLLIAGICLMTLNNATVFAYLDVLGKLRGFAPESIQQVLVALGLVNLLVVAPLSLYLEQRVSASRAIVFGPIVQAVLAFVITNVTSYALWATAAALYTGAQIVTHTFVFALITQWEPTRRAAAATPAMLMLGAACGPILGGVLGQTFGFATLAIATTLFATLALSAFLIARARPPRLLAN